MASTKKELTSTTAWQQLEAFADQLHELARSATDASTFYQELLNGCVSLLAAEGGVVWQQEVNRNWRALHRVQLPVELKESDSQLEAEHRELLASVAASDGPQVLPARSGITGSIVNPLATQVLIARVPAEDKVPRVVELFMPAGVSPEVQDGWRELLDSVCQIAADYHTWDDYRRLRTEVDFHGRALALLQRVNSRPSLKETAFEIANEGRQLIEADRLAVAVRRGSRWELLAASGVDRVDSRSDTTKSLQKLADWASRWGEPLVYSDRGPIEEYPSELQDLLSRHADLSLARSLVVVPQVSAAEGAEIAGQRKTAPAVLIAEQFQTDRGELRQDQVMELADLCLPALAQSARLDRFPLRTLLRWSDYWSERGWLKGLRTPVIWAIILASVVCALLFIERDFEVEAPAQLVPQVERDIFAPTDGTVSSVLVEHGQLVAEGALLATLDDPQLVLDMQRVRGEIDTTQKRLEAIAVARTNRDVREDVASESLSLSAEAQQLDQRLESLRQQAADSSTATAFVADPQSD